MLAKRQRLTKAAFDQCFKAGRRFHAPHLQIIYCAGSEFHAAAVAGKKVASRAVDRNLVRRRLYNALYRLSKKMSLPGTYIVVAKSGAKGCSFQALQSELEGMVGLIAKKKLQ